MFRPLRPLLLVGLLVACSSDSEDSTPTDTSADAAHDTADATDDGAHDGSGDDAGGGDDASADTGEDAAQTPEVCQAVAEPSRAFDTVGPYGTRRHELAADFTVPLADGGEWTLSERWTGCESYVFVPDSLTVSDVDATSIWDEGVAGLVAASPRNAHYFFVSRRSAPAQVESAVRGMQQRVDDALADMSPQDAAHWAERLHVVAAGAGALDAWIGGVIQSGVGQLGMAIDRFQRVRGIGSLADVTRFDGSLEWPWHRNVAYAANEVRYFDFEARRQAALDAEDAVVLEFWSGDVIEQFHDIEVELPTAEELARFDTLELDFVQRCPNPNAPEPGNCGAWDYLAHLWLFDGEGESERRIELARHITTYHREGRWIVDITPALYHLREGGTRRFRWEWAPEWNVQPTATWLRFRFSNRGTGYRPVQVDELWGGRAFNADYNSDRAPIDVEIPADAARVELRAIITGHGAEARNCAEFCNHQHEFIVEGRSFYREHNDTVGNDQACAQRVDQGVVPNQWGTWWFGRGGWCPGQQVDPWIVDLTELATPGQTLSVDYFGWLSGRDPETASGTIHMSSSIVVYAER